MRSFFAVAALCALVLAGCGTTKDLSSAGPEERFAHAKALFDDGDIDDAMNEFTVITLQFQGSTVAADAQFYLGECRFAREEYLLAQFEYSVIRTSYPASARVAEAQYKMGLCYYNLSPPSRLDQQYTRKAIDEFQAFVEYYPSHPLAVDAEAKIRELNDRLARKAYDTARLYATLQYYKAAFLSYDVVIEKYHDTDYAPLAFIEKAELLVERLRYREAEQMINEFLSKYPNSVLRSRAEKVRETITKELGEGSGEPIPRPDSLMSAFPPEGRA